VYRAHTDVRPAEPGQSVERPEGIVFEDLNRDGIFQSGEPGIGGVMVSNGLRVVLTDRRGKYRLPAVTAKDRIDGITIFITKPAGYDVPLDRDNVPQFFYHHLPAGSPPGVHGGSLRFGGLPPTGPLPARINFPLIRTTKRNTFKVVVSGDTQAYSNNEVGYVRDTLASELAAMEGLAAVIVEGDVIGDDLSLYPRFKRVMRAARAPLYLVPGNHDLDFDAPADEHSFDSFKRHWGPTTYSFDIGRVHFVVLDDVSYPCTPEQNRDGLHPYCDDPVHAPAYNGMISARQLQWLENDLAHVPADKLVVLNMHIPPQVFVSMDSTRNQIDNALELYDRLGYGPSGFPRRPALALSGHSHTLENIRPGETYLGWETTLGDRSPGAPPFPQIVAGAACGSWWSADFDDRGIPHSYQRLGAPRGYLIIEFSGNSYRETFKATGKAVDRQMSLAILSPTFTAWADAMLAWLETPSANRPAAPPVNINDLPDTKIVTTGELANTHLTANVWNGARDWQVYLQIDESEPIRMVRTQAGAGEAVLASYDPFALRLQLYAYRFAAVSDSGADRAQGFELFRGRRYGPDFPRPLNEWLLARQSMHLWTAKLPEGLENGVHVARVTAVDRYGRSWTETLIFEVMDERPPAFFKSELFQ
jgi:hypothetical protein